MNGDDDMVEQRHAAVDAIVDSRMVTAIARVTQIIGVPLGLGCIGWAALTLVTMKTDLAVLTDRVSTLTTNLAQVYRAGDAEKDFRLRDMRDEQLGRSIDALGRRVDRLEQIGQK